MPPRKKKTAAESAAPTADSELPNALKRPQAKGFARDEDPPDDIQPNAMPSGMAIRTVQEMRVGAGNEDQIASGRGLTYEWEFVAAQIIDRVAVVEDVTGAGGSTGGLRYTHTQTVPSSSWTVAHGLGTKPGVLVIENSGQELLAEVHYPNDNQTVIVFGSPFAGTAYLRG